MPTDESVKKIAPRERPTEEERTVEAPKEVRSVPAPEKPAPSKEIPVLPPAPPPVSPTPKIIPPQDAVLLKIEAILAEGMQEVYAGLSPEAKLPFKAKGEEVARTIQTMMQTAKVKARKVLKLIVEWLRMIPGVNKFFIEQEAAIKTQKIIHVAEERK